MCSLNDFCLIDKWDHVFNSPPPLRPHDPTIFFHKVNLNSIFSNRQINFCNFDVNILSPCSSNTSIHHLFSNLPNFGFCDWFINQIAACVIGRSWAAEANSSYSFRFSLCGTSIPCSSRHLVNFLPPSVKRPRSHIPEWPSLVSTASKNLIPTSNGSTRTRHQSTCLGEFRFYVGFENGFL